ncbi:hypothetical protein Tco_0145630 [Tanacetum coccineum]
MLTDLSSRRTTSVTVMQMPPPDPNKTYTKPPSEIQILKFIKTLGYDEDPETKKIAISKMVTIRLHQPCRAILSIVHSANLDFASLIWDEFEWQTVERSSRLSKMSKLLYTYFTKLIINYFLSNNKGIPRRSSSKLHSSQDDQPLTKLSNTVKGDYKFGMEIPNTIISDAIKKLTRYKFYMANKVESENAKVVDEPEEQHVSLVKSGRGKGFMCYGNQVANVPTSLKKVVFPRKTRSQTIVEETFVGGLVNSVSIQELHNQQCQRSQLTIDRQTKKVVADMYNVWGEKLKGPAVDDLAVQSLLDLRKRSNANRLEILKQAVAGEGSSAAHNKYYDSSNNDSDATLYSSSSDKTEDSANETDDADESDMNLSDDNPNGDDAAGYEVFMHNKSTATPNSTYLSPTVTSSSLDFIQTLQDETPVNELTDFMSHLMYTDAQTTSVVHNPEGNPELTSYISGASKVSLVREYDHKLKAVTNFNLSKAFEKAVQAKVLTEIKKLLPTHILKVVANYVRPRLNTSMLDVMKNNQINLFTQSSTSTDDLLKMDLKLKLLNRIYESKSNTTHPTNQKLYDTLYESVCLDHDAHNAQDAKPSFHKRSHDNQDSLNNYEGENKKKR